MTVPLLSMSGVQKSFLGVQALTDGSLELERGEIHALCGGNGAGKSTVLSILAGFFSPDAGEIAIEGQSVRFADARQALDAGIAIVQQELSAVPQLTVAENIYLGAEPRRHGFVDFKRMNRQAQDLLAALGFEIDATARMGSLSIAAQQLVEIAKALSHRNADIVIFDEPTSAIGERDTERLFRAIRALADAGKGIIYVTHRLTEIFTIATTYTVFKDGARVASGQVADIDRERLIEMMIGGAIEGEFVKENQPRETPLLEVRDLSRRPSFETIGLSLHQGEILGIYGLVGSGRSEFLDTLFGLAAPDTGDVSVDGVRVKGGDVAEAIDAGLAYVTEDRKDSGLVLSASVGRNLSLSVLKRLHRHGFIREREERAAVSRTIDMMRIRTPGPDQLVGNLSGGNQQKVVFGRGILTEPKVLLLDEPTRGVDVGAKKEIYRFMSDFAVRGGGVLLVSSDIEEVIGMSDRIVVFRQGRVVQAFDRAQATQKNIMMAAV